MDLRERRPGDADPESATEPGNDTLDQQRQSTDRLLAASERVIPQALSANSAAFIAANRQHGGQ